MAMEPNSAAAAAAIASVLDLGNCNFDGIDGGVGGTSVDDHVSMTMDPTDLDVHTLNSLLDMPEPGSEGANALALGSAAAAAAAAVTATSLDAEVVQAVPFSGPEAGHQSTASHEAIPDADAEELELDNLQHGTFDGALLDTLSTSQGS